MLFSICDARLVHGMIFADFGRFLAVSLVQNMISSPVRLQSSGDMPTICTHNFRLSSFMAEVVAVLQAKMISLTGYLDII